MRCTDLAAALRSRACSLGLSLFVGIATTAACAAAPAAPPATPPSKAPAQAKPATPPKPGDSKPGDSKPGGPPSAPLEISEPNEPLIPTPAPAKPAVKPAVPAAPIMPRVIKDDAMKIVTRAREEVGKLKSLDIVTETTMENVAADRQLPDLGVRRRVELRWIHTDAISMPLMRVTDLVPGDGGFVTAEALVFDGRKALLVQDAKQQYTDPGRRWMEVAGSRFTALPRWYISERTSALTPKDAEIDRGLEPIVVGARIVGVEEFDGVECDVVELFKSQDVISFDDKGVPTIVDTVQFTETCHFARVDGLPRKVVIKSLSGPEGTVKSGEVTTLLYLQVRANPDFDNARFSTTPPAGYTSTGDAGVAPGAAPVGAPAAAPQG